MLIDGERIEAGSELRATVAIVGAGPAGLTIARELSAAGIDCIILEAGGTETEHAKETGHQLTPAGIYDLGQSRFRGLGGSSQRWLSGGWRARPMDPLDFQERASVPDGAWPLSHEELVPYFERAQEVCGLIGYDYDYDRWIAKEQDPQLLRLEAPDLRTVIFRVAPPKRFQNMAEEVEFTPRLRVVLHAHVTHIGRGEGGAVTGLMVRARGRSGYQVTANAYVLATGGIDTPRLLLASGEIGNENDQVGRYFQEHLHLDGGTFRLAKPGDTSRLLGFYPPHFSPDGTKIQAALGLTEECMKREGLLNTTLWLYPLHSTHSTDGMRSLYEIRSALSDRRLPRDLATHAAHMIKDLGALGEVVQRRFTRKPVPPDCAQIAIEAEQQPNPDSRVILSRERDEFGMLIPRLEWRIADADRASIRKTQDLIDARLRAKGLGSLERKWGDESPLAELGGGSHHMGTTRMHLNPRRGVVDKHSRVYGCPNLYVAGSSVFPSSGSANPTLTLLGLALRLCDHLKTELNRAGQPA